jgi:hypothetical protein
MLGAFPARIPPFIIPTGVPLSCVCLIAPPARNGTAKRCRPESHHVSRSLERLAEVGYISSHSMSGAMTTISADQHSAAAYAGSYQSRGQDYGGGQYRPAR